MLDYSNVLNNINAAFISTSGHKAGGNVSHTRMLSANPMALLVHTFYTERKSLQLAKHKGSSIWCRTKCLELISTNVKKTPSFRAIFAIRKLGKSPHLCSRAVRPGLFFLDFPKPNPKPKQIFYHLCTPIEHISIYLSYCSMAT